MILIYYYYTCQGPEVQPLRCAIGILYGCSTVYGSFVRHGVLFDGRKSKLLSNCYNNQYTIINSAFNF